MGIWRRLFERIGGGRSPIALRYFEDVWPVELEAIARRRSRNDRPKLQANGNKEPGTHSKKGEEEPRSPNPDRIFPGGGVFVGAPSQADKADPANPDRYKMRPQPVPCTATGLALSGGGIRSAGVCLGALQALDKNKRLESLDYLSTVSGGGYIGACLSAAMSGKDGAFPFGSDVRDNDSIAHLRNYSNYLMPRGRSALRNGAEAAAVILRGLLANGVIVVTLLIFAALLTQIAFPKPETLLQGSFWVRFLYRLFGQSPAGLLAMPFFATLVSAGLLTAILLFWAVLQSSPHTQNSPSDTRGFMLWTARILLLLTIALALFDLQPILIKKWIAFADFIHQSGSKRDVKAWIKSVTALLTAFTGLVTVFSSTLTRFLKISERSAARSTMTLRVITRAVMLLAAALVPLALWITYIAFSAALMAPSPFSGLLHMLGRTFGGDIPAVWILWSIGTLISFGLGANGYSLHRFYRDRLSKAFLFKPEPGQIEPSALDDLKLSQLKDGKAPYHIFNAALNVQGSPDANRRGRNADFFTFTTDYIGSDLTLYSSTNDKERYAPTTGMEAIEPRLNVATVMAISGAAVSANMGSNTVRALSPTLALLNVRLGYWLRNPRFWAAHSAPVLTIRKGLNRVFDKVYLAAEIFNLLDETKSVVYLTDGGHIENLGLYELLKRGCKAIIVVDAEADPDLAFPSFLKVQRYARIDLGVRIELPWEEIAHRKWKFENGPPGLPAPHCAVGRIFYADGSEGVLLYFKSSVSGDEKDYILDYRRRNPEFPHETTGDQFFTEEQFEMYRALGFHMVDGFFARNHPFAYRYPFPSAGRGQSMLDGPDKVLDAVDDLIPKRL